MNNLSKIECILIDDQEEEQEMFAIALRASGLPAKCTYYSGALEALAQLNKEQETKPGLIWVDVTMPRISGFDCLQKVKAIEHLKLRPVYACSLNHSPEPRQQALQLGAADYLIKPPNLGAMVQMLQH